MRLTIRLPDGLAAHVDADSLDVFTVEWHKAMKRNQLIEVVGAFGERWMVNPFQIIYVKVT